MSEEAPKTFEEARRAAEARIMGDEAAPRPPEKGPDPEATEQAAAAPASEEQSAQKESKPIPPKKEVVTVNVDGKEVEMTTTEHDRLVKLGMEIGDEGAVQTARQLEQFAQRNPGAARALDKIMGKVAANPEQVKEMLAKLGLEDDTEQEQLDPKEARIRELEAELAAAKGGKPQDAQSVLQQKVKAAKSAYPALEAYSDDELAERIELRLLKGQTAQQAINDLVRSGISRSRNQADSKRQAAERQRGVRPNAGDGTASTSVSAPKPRTADDLVNGKVMRDVLAGVNRQ